MTKRRRRHPPMLQIGGWPLGQRPERRTPQGGLRHDEDTRLSIAGWHRTTTKDFDTGSTWTWHRDGCERRSQGWCGCGDPPLPDEEHPS